MRDFLQTKSDWLAWVKELKAYLWEYKDESTHIIELDAAKKAALLPSPYEDSLKFQHNMTVFTILSKHFRDCNSVEIGKVNITTGGDFATDLFVELDKLWAPNYYSAAANKIDELEAAYNTFDGNPVKYFQTIQTLEQWLVEHNHSPNKVQVLKSCDSLSVKMAMAVKMQL